jgi:hypothetical protein
MLRTIHGPGTGQFFPGTEFEDNNSLARAFGWLEGFRALSQIRPKLLKIKK